jgi:hypothetical protein
MLNSFPTHLDADDASDCGDVTVRPATDADADGIRQLEELEGRDAGDRPHLVADRDGAVVACLSLADATALGDPFHPTAEAIDLLRAHATRFSHLQTERSNTMPSIHRTRSRRVAAAAAALAALLVTLIVSATAPAAPKPGFLPGTWNVTGTISGSAVDGPMSTVFGGSIRMTLKVGSNSKVGGNGTWQMTMKGSGPVNSTMNGTAAVTLSGSAVSVRFAGQQSVTGTVSDGVLSTPIRMSRPLAGKLVIKRAGKCRVTGTSPMNGGAKLTWTALLAGSGTCRA